MFSFYTISHLGHAFIILLVYQSINHFIVDKLYPYLDTLALGIHC